MTETAPHNPTAEEAVVGAVINMPELFDTLAPLLGEEGGKAFYIHRLGWVWDAFQALRDADQEIDYLTICDQLDRAGRLTEAGGPAWLTALITRVPDTLHAESYASIVAEDHTRRKLIRYAGTVAAAAHDREHDIAHALADADRALADISVWTGRKSGMLNMAHAIASADRATEAASKAGGASIKTGLVDLDSKLGGLYPSDMIVIAARPGEGKTALMLTIAANISLGRPSAALDGHIVPLVKPTPSAFFSLEMPVNQIIWRLASQYTGIPSKKLRDGDLVGDAWDKYYSFIGESTGTPLFISHPGNRPTIAELRAEMRKMVSEHGVRVFFIDQLNYINAMMDGRAGDNIKLNAVAHDLKALANELAVTIIVAHQMNRNSDNVSEDPTTADLDQAGDKPADVVVFIRHKFSGEFVQSSWLYLAKSRMGERGRCPVVFIGERTRFESATRVF